MGVRLSVRCKGGPLVIALRSPDGTRSAVNRAGRLKTRIERRLDTAHSSSRQSGHDLSSLSGGRGSAKCGEGRAKEREDAWHRVNTAIAMKIFPRSGTLLALLHIPQGSNFQLLTDASVLEFHEHYQLCLVNLSSRVPGKRRQGASENWDWRSRARPILQNLTVSHRAWRA